MKFTSKLINFLINSWSLTVLMLISNGVYNARFEVFTAVKVLNGRDCGRIAGGGGGGGGGGGVYL
jgi:hypothetical protein